MVIHSSFLAQNGLHMPCHLFWRVSKRNVDMKWLKDINNFFQVTILFTFVLLGKGTRDIFTSGCKGGGKGFSTNYSSWISFPSWTSIDVLASNRGTFAFDFGSSNTSPLLKNMALHCSLGPSHLGCSSWLGRAPFGLSLPSLFNCHITCCINYYCWCYWLCINCFIVWCIELNNYTISTCWCY